MSQSIVKGAWLVTALLWPLLRWPISIEVFLQFVRTLYYWDTPGMRAGWTFILHFAVLVALTYFVSVHKPKGM